MATELRSMMRHHCRLHILLWLRLLHAVAERHRRRLSHSRHLPHHAVVQFSRGHAAYGSLLVTARRHLLHAMTAAARQHSHLLIGQVRGRCSSLPAGWRLSRSLLIGQVRRRRRNRPR